MRVFTAGLLLAAALLTSGAALADAKSEPVNSGHVKAQLVSRSAAAVPGTTLYMGLRQSIETGWHTYWRNPGDSGEATRLKWTLPAGWDAGEIVWPAPRLLPLGPLMNYGYENEVVLPVPVKVPASAKAGQTVSLQAAVSYLVCKDVCVPEDAIVKLDLPVAASAAGDDPAGGPLIAKALDAAPRAALVQAAFEASPQALKLSITGAPLAQADMTGAYFYPFSGAVIDHAARQTIERGPQGLTLNLTPSSAAATAPPLQALDGVLVLKTGAYEVAAKAGSLLPGAAGLGPAPSAGSAETAGAAAPGGPPLGLIAAAGLAFVGGLILNLMPCVFPVLSMKAAALAGHASDARSTRAQGLAYMAGVLATFLALGGLLIAVRAAGEGVGWGFQLQSPAVVAALSLIMLLTALNMSGVFEIGTSVQGVGSDLAAKGGLAGAAFTGALAVVVAAPCTAPFMAPALGFALTQPAWVAMTVFLALGLGMALPFTALAFSPALLKRLPRPGAWMDTFRKALAFPMYGAAAWLGWVLAQQTDSAGLARLFAAAVIAAFAAWLYGRGQSPANSRAKTLALAGAGLAGLVLAAGAAAALPYAPAPTAGSGPRTADNGLEQEPYSAERLAELRSANIPVFVDFTAAWCVTCKVNEKTTLSTAKVAQVFKDTGAVYMVGDWTNRNAEIAGILAQYGRAGVPLYLVYGAGNKDAVVLPQFLTEPTVRAALQKAAAS